MSTQSKNVLVVSINSATAIPILRFVADRLNANANVRVAECRIQGVSTSWPDVAITSLGNFSNSKDFLSQNALFKIFKYVKASLFFMKWSLKRAPLTVYLIDYQLVGIVAAIARLLRMKHARIVYHQFETVEPDRVAGRLNQWFWNCFRRNINRVDLVIVPESNRLSYLIELTQYDRQKTILMPNTCKQQGLTGAVVHDGLKDIPNDAVVIGHVGNVGPDHYLDTFIRTVNAMRDDENAYFVLIGNIASSVRTAFQGANNPRLILLDAVPHADLVKVYCRIDLGLILYKGIDRNFEFCAPNKLYEYWSYGIPVVAHPLKGLQSVFVDECLGRLVCLEEHSGFEKLLRATVRTTAFSREKLIKYFNDKLSIDRYLDNFEVALNSMGESNFR